jgi:hypothetical protein
MRIHIPYKKYLSYGTHLGSEDPDTAFCQKELKNFLFDLVCCTYRIKLAVLNCWNFLVLYLRKIYV